MESRLLSGKFLQAGGRSSVGDRNASQPRERRLPSAIANTVKLHMSLQVTLHTGFTHTSHLAALQVTQTRAQCCECVVGPKVCVKCGLQVMKTAMTLRTCRKSAVAAAVQSHPAAAVPQYPRPADEGTYVSFQQKHLRAASE